MIELGKIQTLKVARKTANGFYLSSPMAPADEVLLPNSNIPSGLKVSDEVEVFVYKDSEDRPVATTKRPRLILDEVASLQVKEVTTIGAFMDWGMPKDLFLPYREQKVKVKVGKNYLVGLYIDSSQRLCATMKIYDFLRTDSTYKLDDKVRGMVYEISEDLGALVAVDRKYNALLPKTEQIRGIKVGDTIEARVVKVRDDGKLDLSLRERAHIQLGKDAEVIMEKLGQGGGVLHLDDKSSPQDIARQLSMSKGAFKKAVGRLLKENKIKFIPGGIELI